MADPQKNEEEEGKKEEKEEELLKNALTNYFFSPDESPTSIRVRQRPPFLKTSAHDARGDAISLVFENIINRKFPLWAAYKLAYNFVDLFEADLSTGRVPFAKNSQQPFEEAASWTTKVAEHFDRYLTELKEGSRELPVKPSNWDNLPFSFCAHRNRRHKLEDRHIILPSLAAFDDLCLDGGGEHAEDAFFAVFDGHNGPECAAYASAHFLECLFESLSNGISEESLLEDVFSKVDERLTERCRSQFYKSGTTASCVFLKERKTAFLAWCGDSAIAIMKEQRVVTLSSPHKPEIPSEQKRIEEAGGMVVSVQGVPRLNGVLNVSRSLGDIRAKPMVSSSPDLLTYPICEHGDDDDDYILFLASDGVWESLDEQEIFEAVCTFVNSHSVDDFQLLADFVANKAKEADSTDNLTLICVYLKPLGDVWEKFSRKSES